MLDSSNIQGLTKLAEEGTAQMKKQISIFEKSLQDMVKNAPKEDQPYIEEFKSKINKAFNLAKMGKADEAQAVIKSFQHGSKNNKQGV